MSDPRENPNVILADAHERIKELENAFGVNQLLFMVAEAIEKKANDMNGEDSATCAAIREVALQVEIIAIRAQRAGL